MAKATEASTKVSVMVADDINVQWVQGVEALAQSWTQLLDNQIPPSTGLMVSL